MQIVELEKILEILSNIRARYNRCDIDEAACYHVLSDAITRVCNTPIINIVQCKECVYNGEYTDCPLNGYPKTDDSFCSYGEVRDE